MFESPTPTGTRHVPGEAVVIDAALLNNLYILGRKEESCMTVKDADLEIPADMPEDMMADALDLQSKAMDALNLWETVGACPIKVGALLANAIAGFTTEEKLREHFTTVIPKNLDNYRIYQISELARDDLRGVDRVLDLLDLLGVGLIVDPFKTPEGAVRYHLIPPGQREAQL